MQLFSMQFFICLSVLAVLYFTVCRKYQWICLLVGSIAFFACFGAKNLLYIGITSFSIWLGGLAMGKIEEAGSRMRKAEGITKEQKKEIKRKCRRKKGWILVILLLLNFGILGYFKYWNGILDKTVHIPIIPVRALFP